MFELVIGSKNTSSWSLRPWFVMKAFGIPFKETLIAFGKPDTKSQIEAHSPSGLVPVLKMGNEVICDSLAIAETLADLYPDKRLWPIDQTRRNIGRMISCEMHSGFQSVRTEMPMDFVNRHEGFQPNANTQKDIDRIVALWSDARARHQDLGPFLLGELSIADAMYAPVVSRFRSYDIEVSAAAQAYMEAMWHHMAMKEWRQGAALEV